MGKILLCIRLAKIKNFEVEEIQGKYTLSCFANGNKNWYTSGISLVVQWLRLHAPKAGGPGSIPGQRTRSHMLQLRVCIPQLKFPHASTKDPACCNKDPAHGNEEPVCCN